MTDERELPPVSGGVSVVALPDGSVDTYYRVFSGDEGRVETREAFAGEAGPDGPGSFEIERTAVEPGGRSVNAAEQASALGDDVTLYGHLDDPIFEDLQFETHSMGEPAEVAVHSYEDDDLMFVEGSADLDSWSLDDLRAAAGEGFEEAVTPDALVCTNWASVDGLGDALVDLAGLDVAGEWLVFDPGEIGSRSAAAIREVVDALAALESRGRYEVVLTANERELAAVAAALDVEAAAGVDAGSAGADESGTNEALLAAVREAAGLAGVVEHGVEAATVASTEGTATVPNFEVESPARHTGGGDRFDAGLAHGLAAGWSWAEAAELGNRCASFYVATGRTGTASELTTFGVEESRNAVGVE